ncbi:MAG TPA: hypothetical protein VGQ76_20225 [Thermoanaerobaculia bacterium]|jgi:hypothetical protein|nr:hypothetical protein [Thermoanaerobaculia bacterium]
MSSTRRDFARSLAIAGALARVTVPLAAADILAQTPPTPVPPPVGKALTEVVRASYAQHLDDAELARIDKDFQDYASMLVRFRKFELANADEPDFTFASLTERWT